MLLILKMNEKFKTYNKITMNEMPEYSTEKKRFMLTTISVGIFRLAAKLKP